MFIHELAFITIKSLGECIEDGADYECECHSGYHFNDETCVDVDECAEEPCGNGECTNTPGSYRSI